MAKDISKTIAGLMAKAEATDSDAERETYFAKAQQLSTLHGIDAMVAMSENKEREKRSDLKPEKRIYEAGQKGDRGAGAYSELFASIGRPNDVKTYRDNAEVEAFGMPSDLDTVEKLYYTILPQMVKSCMTYLDSDEWRVPGNKGKLDAKKSFYRAYRDRIERRLQEARRDAVEEAERTYHGGAAVALVSKDKQVNQLYWKNVKGFRRRGVIGGANRAAAGAGRQAASNVRLGGGTSLQGQRRGIGK